MNPIKLLCNGQNDRKSLGRVSLSLSILLALRISVAETQANPRLILWDSAGTGATIAIDDGSPLDGSALPGIVTWSGSLGEWSGTLTSGFTKPHDGTTFHPEMTIEGDLTWDVTRAPNPGVASAIRVSLTEVDFGPPYPNAQFLVETTGDSDVFDGRGRVTPFAHADPSNVLADTINPFTPGPGRQIPLTDAFTHGFSGSIQVSKLGAPVNLAYPYSITLDTIIGAVEPNQPHEHYAFRTTLQHLHVPDTGSSFLLLGLGLASMGLLTRGQKPSSGSTPRRHP